jgi:type IV secretion system protein VirB10
MGVVWWKKANPPDEPVKERLPASMGPVVAYTPPKLLIPPQTSTPVALTSPPVRPTPQPMPQSVQPLAAPPADPVSRVAPSVAAIVYPSPKMMTYAAAAPPPQPSSDPAASPGNASPGVIYASSKLDGVQSGLLGDQTMLLMPGLLPCIMDTAINSTFVGPVQCHIAADIKPRGVTLLGRGSIVHGWYHNDIQTGQSRMFVQADWVHDPSTGCYIKFDNAPISDTIGQTGITGNVDQHIWERFGAAMLLTLGQGGESLAQAALSKGGNTYLSFNGGSGGLDSIASAILRKQIEIPPTITVHQGTSIAVFVVKPLDFSKCYSLAIKDK